MGASHKKWVPLESNPDVLNEYAAKLGADMSQYQFCDVFGLDEASGRGGRSCGWTDWEPAPCTMRRLQPG